MKKILLLTLLIALTVGSAFSQADLQPAAIVNLTRSEPITVRQLRTEVDRLQAASNQTLTVAQRREVLDAMINERLVLQAAARDRIMVTDNEVNQQIQQLRTGMAQQLGRQPTDAEFAQVVRSQYNMDVQAFREQLQKQLIVQKYLMAKKGTPIESVRPPSEAEIREQYNLVKAQLVRPETVRFTMIMVPYGADAASRTAARQTADRLHREIGSNPSKFDEAVARSVAPNSGYQAGDAGYVPRNQEARSVVGQPLLDAAFSTRQGQVSNVVEGLQGFCIIKVTENHAQKNLELDDIFQLGTRITVRDYIGQAMYSEKQQAAVIQASEELVTELRSGRPFQVFENNLNWQ
ncbi:MAG: peptidyl-prolyl cis-trans isomerase [Treponema sp.]|jgi:parvulin-like peptidyl-prolyl isomerase|nr:peptidyl-prolyl cis-trans isomerase [Treponema sp.]